MDKVKPTKLIKTIAAITVYTAIMVGTLNAYDGVNLYEGHKETFYNLPMHRVVTKAQENGYTGEYWEREEDGCKMFGPYVICAGHRSRYGQVINTSLGPGLILDTGEFAKTDKTAIDIATTW